MRTTRVIPVLLLKRAGLVKTVKFREPKYIGDPINAVKIFNEKEVDELIFLDITASVDSTVPPLQLISKIASECFMPLSYGGGIRTIKDIETILGLGVEKVCINSSAFENPSLIESGANVFGSQSIVVSIDVKKQSDGRYEVYTHSGKKSAKIDPVSYAKQVEACGAGELLLNSMDRDGTMSGFDISLINSVSEAVSIPVIACGGAGELSHFISAVREGGASAVAAGSVFVFQGRHRAVLISYPSKEDIDSINMNQRG